MADPSPSAHSVPPRGIALLNLATETDVERLRQAAMLLEQENARLFRRMEALVAELAEARGEDARSLQLEIDLLKEQLASRTKALFGDSSERRCNGEHQDNEERKEPRGDPREATLRAVRNPGTVTLARDLKSSES